MADKKESWVKDDNKNIIGKDTTYTKSDGSSRTVHQKVVNVPLFGPSAGSVTGETRNHPDGTSTNHSESSSGCCYITSACLDSMGLPRTSLEMKAMKLLTKDYILKSFQGKKDYILYGRKAPGIVEAIKARPDSRRIWEEVYGTLKEITSTIISGDYQKGHSQYKGLVLGLEAKFAKTA